MDEWEYTVVVLTGSSAAQDEETLAPLGRKGWELVQIFGENLAYMKRRKL